MLDTDTKRRIDTARDILVGKVPDPKSQVEQITIALIYKFMDDMDAESEELGGKRKFFTGNFARYGWAKLMRSGLGGHETLALYGEGITKMTENPGLPPLFRDIFKNAYLPYRDPETLKAFLKIIDEFTYDHSERLGDAFEYLLSVLGSQGDAGQFRTPRHIIDFTVRIVDPKKDEAVLDPACGTAGFLISAYKHILRANSDEKGRSKLTPDDRGRLAKNFKGYDISPDMVRLSLVNLYLHGFTDPHIHEYDTLTQEERWNEFADVILANPPFMSPKGGIKPHKRFSIQAKRSEVLFVDYMAEHLTPNGRAGIIVPEGIIFQSQTAYTELRKMLVENSLVAVISLPAGCFNPYSGVKTSILILDKSLAKQAQTIAFFKVENDGFGLGAQRRPIDKDDLPQVEAELADYLQALRSKAYIDTLNVTTGLIVPKERIAANGDYNLSGERYREGGVRTNQFPLVRIGDVCAINPSKNKIMSLKGDTRVSFVPMADLNENRMTFQPSGGKSLSEVGASYTYFEDGDVLLAKVTPCFENGKAGVARGLLNGIGFGSSEFYVLRSDGQVLPEWVYFCVMHPLFRGPAVAQMTGTGGLQRVRRDYVENFQIPLPPLEVQKEIVAEIEGYQKVINGARAVLESYRPHIPIHSDWSEMPLGEICRFIDYRGKTPEKTTSGIPLITAKNVRGGYINPEPREFIAERDYDGWMTRGIPQVGDVLFTMEAPLGNVAEITMTGRFALAQRLVALCPNRELLVGSFLKDILLTQTLQEKILAHQSGTTVYGIKASVLKEITIPVPPLATQQAIVAEIEAEQALVAANRELITRFERKIQATLARIWGEPSADPLTEIADGGGNAIEPKRPRARSAADEFEVDRIPVTPLARAAEEPAQYGSAGKRNGRSVEKAERSSAPASYDYEKDELIALLREALAEVGPSERDVLIRTASQKLGYGRTGQVVAKMLNNAIRNAKIRGVLFEEDGLLKADRTPVDQWDRDFLKEQFLTAISQKGRTWTDRDEAVRTFARWLGFRKKGPVIEETTLSLINGLLREGRLEKDGQDWIRRV